jgi:hypothetical protein
VVRLNPALTALIQATYLGGTGVGLIDYEAANSLAVHPASGDVYVAGVTFSTGFPGTAGGAQHSHAVDGGNDDAFVARLNPTLTTLVQATYLGGNGSDPARALAIHPASGRPGQSRPQAGNDDGL